MSIRVVMDVKDFVASDVAGAGEVVLRVGVVRLRRSGKAGEGRRGGDVVSNDQRASCDNGSDKGGF